MTKIQISTRELVLAQQEWLQAGAMAHLSSILSAEAKRPLPTLRKPRGRNAKVSAELKRLS